MLVQLNKCVVVCGSDLQRGISGDRCLSSSILFKSHGGTMEEACMSRSCKTTSSKSVILVKTLVYT